MSTTPRTDREAGWAIANQYGQSTSRELLTDCKGVFVHAVFARQLETELTAMTARAEKAEAELEDVSALLRRVSWHLPQNNLLYIQVIDFLKRHKLAGKILRAEKEASK